MTRPLFCDTALGYLGYWATWVTGNCMVMQLCIQIKCTQLGLADHGAGQRKPPCKFWQPAVRHLPNLGLGSPWVRGLLFLLEPPTLIRCFNKNTPTIGIHGPGILKAAGRMDRGQCRCAHNAWAAASSYQQCQLLSSFSWFHLQESSNSARLKR